MRWLQLFKESNCTVTSTWTNNEDNREHHTWRAWGSWVCKKQHDYIMGPKDLRSSTCYLNRVRVRTWDHFPVIVEIEERDPRKKKGVKDWVGWIPRSEVNDDRTKILKDGRDVWALCRIDWRKLRPRSRVPGQLCGTETSSPCWT